LQVPSSLSCDSGPDILATWTDRRSAILAFIHKIRHTAVAVAGLLTAALCLVQPSGALAANASEMFEDGNRLFRDELYWAALLRYQQAGEAGMNTPLLHYNTGIAHYRAQQHTRARESLLKAAREPRLRAITHYNLGLNSYAANDIDDALHYGAGPAKQQENKRVCSARDRPFATHGQRDRSCHASRSGQRGAKRVIPT
jgi:tetratricopeptide (TPR) repeat protein